MISARLFGGFELRNSNGEELTLGTRKARALLAFLIIERGQWHSRGRLAGLLWGDRAHTQARNSLSQALYEIHRLEETSDATIVERTSERVRIVEGVIDSDVDQFRERLNGNALEAAMLRTGDLLGGVDLRDQAFVDWLVAKRAEYQEALSIGLRALASPAKGHEDLDVALRAARHLIALNPLDEAARRQLMHLLSQTGNRAEAICQYEICANLLKDELGIEPEAATQRLLDEIRRAQTKQPSLTSTETLEKVTIRTLHEATSSQSHESPWTSPESIERHNLIDPQAHDDTPVLAVVPFKNLSTEPDVGYLGEGLADDILFSLSGFRWFKVLGRSSSFRLTEANFTLKDIHRTFGATHLVSGQIRLSGTKLRISVELTDCRSERQVWSARYNDNVDRLFEVEDQMVRQIASSIVPALEESEMQLLLNRPPNSMSAYEFLQRGNWHLFRNLSSYDGDDEARRCFEAALKLDPNYAAALAALAYVKYRNASKYIATNFREHIEDSRQTALQALSIDPREPRALRYLAGALSMLGDQEGARQAFQRSIELCPSYATAYSGLAFSHDFLGQFAEAQTAADQTMLLRPHDPILCKCVISKSIADYQTGDYERAERIAQNSIRTNSVWWMSNALLAASMAQQKKLAEALAVTKRLRATYPGLKLEKLAAGLPFTDPAHRDHLVEGLVQAGWRD